MSTDMQLLMVHADDEGGQVLEDGVGEEATHGAAAPEDAGGPEHLFDLGGDPQDLYAQRWGVIAPKGDRGDRLLDLIAPLIKFRQEQQRGEPVKVYRVDFDAIRSLADAVTWKKLHYDASGDLEIETPRYQLILGDLHELPLEIQQVQQAEGFVGRLAFREDEAYRRYAEKVIRWANKPSPKTKGNTLFYTVHDGTPATSIGYRSLIKPGVEVARSRQERGQFNAELITDAGDQWSMSPDDFVQQVDAQGEAAVLFSLSHGEGAPRRGWKVPAGQHARQGAMSFGQGVRLKGSDLGERPFLPGGLWFMLACFGAGTPRGSAYAHWLSKLKSVGQFGGNVDGVLASLPHADDPRPFIADLPQTVLAGENGPLGVMGHIDLAWTYSFQELDQGPMNKSGRFMAILRSALKRDRMGLSLRELTRFFEQANTELTSLYDQEAASKARGSAYEVDVARRGHLWMLRQDLSAYILLGDPACRVPLSAPAHQSQSLSASSLLGFSAPAATTPTQQTAADDAPALPMDIEDLEEAIGYVLSGEMSVKAAAKEYDLDKGTLRDLVDRYRTGGRAAVGAS